MRFTKMHGLGNDYIYVNCFQQRISAPSRLARALSDRHFGIGGDGLILILPSRRADARMRIFNADGSEAEMCGNGLRCVAKYVYEHGLCRKKTLRIETGRGILTVDLHVRGGTVRAVTVNMGRPELELSRIPVDSGRVTRVGEHEYAIDGVAGAMTFVSMGNPHAVMFVDDVQAVEAQRLGPQIERHEAFPRRTNVHWVQVKSAGEVVMRTWERGSNLTLACGTGACAVCVAGVLTGRTSRRLLAHLPGGDLRLEWHEADGCVYMTGPATEVFSGEWPARPRRRKS